MPGALPNTCMFTVLVHLVVIISAARLFAVLFGRKEERIYE